MSTTSNDSLELQSSKQLAETAVANALAGVSETNNVLTGMKSGFESNLNTPLLNRELTDLQTKLTLKFFMLDIDIFNADTSIK